MFERFVNVLIIVVLITFGVLFGALATSRQWHNVPSTFKNDAYGHVFQSTSTEAYVGTQKSFTCSVSSSARQNQVVWRRNTDDIIAVTKAVDNETCSTTFIEEKIANKYTFSCDGNRTFTWTIHSLAATDNLTSLWCSSNTLTIHDNNTRSNIVLLKVRLADGPAEDDVLLSPSNTTYTLEEGQTLGDIECSARCFPNCTYAWFMSGAPYVTEPVLQLGVVNRTDVGMYVCIATNTLTHTTAYRSVKLFIIYGPDKISMNVSSRHVVAEGSVMPNISCTASCWPSCVARWTRSDGPDGDGQHTPANLVGLRQVSGVLTLGTVHPGSSGNYTCTTTNLLTGFNMTLHESFELVVLCLPKAPDDFFYIQHFHNQSQQFCWYTSTKDMCSLYQGFKIQVMSEADNSWVTVVSIPDSRIDVVTPGRRCASIDQPLSPGEHTARIIVGHTTPNYKTLSIQTFTVEGSQYITIGTLYLAVAIITCIALVGCYSLIFAVHGILRRMRARQTTDVSRRTLHVSHIDLPSITENPKPCTGPVRPTEQHNSENSAYVSNANRSGYSSYLCYSASFHENQPISLGDVGT